MQAGQTRRTSRCAITPISADDSRYGSTPIEFTPQWLLNVGIRWDDYKSSLNTPQYTLDGKTTAAMTSLLSACGSDSTPIGQTTPPVTQPVETFSSPQVAFMSDVHFENIYGDLKSAQFSGIPTKDGKNATIRTMYAQLTSTRLFNENYFAFRAALDDAYGKGIRLVALPGDYSDDAQPINIDGIAAILTEYQAKGMRFRTGRFARQFGDAIKGVFVT